MTLKGFGRAEIPACGRVLPVLVDSNHCTLPTPTPPPPSDRAGAPACAGPWEVELAQRQESLGTELHKTLTQRGDRLTPHATCHVMFLLLDSTALATTPVPYQASEKEILQVPLCALFFSLEGERV